MISEKMTERLNGQIALEGYASFLYLSMACWCDFQGLAGCAAFMHRQSAEERMHMLKIVHYLNEVGGRAIVPAIAQPPADQESADQMFKAVYAHEQKVTKSIHELINLANAENDYATLNFLQWYVAEQREEEALMRGLLDRIQLIGDSPMRLYYIDKEVDAINQAAANAAAAEKAG
jgi:ferritin